MERKRISAQKLSEQIAEVLEERIVGGVYAVGERLPPERQLAAEFGVSRPPLRDALGALAARQLLHSRPGAGAACHQLPQPGRADRIRAVRRLRAARPDARADGTACRTRAAASGAGAGR